MSSLLALIGDPIIHIFQRVLGANPVKHQKSSPSSDSVMFSLHGAAWDFDQEGVSHESYTHAPEASMLPRPLSAESKSCPSA